MGKISHHLIFLKQYYYYCYYYFCYTEMFLKIFKVMWKSERQQPGFRRHGTMDLERWTFFFLVTLESPIKSPRPRDRAKVRVVWTWFSVFASCIRHSLYHLNYYFVLVQPELFKYICLNNLTPPQKKAARQRNCRLETFYFQGKMIRITEHQLTRNYLLLSVRHVMESFN